MFDGKKVSIVFPAYNEEENIAEAVRDFQKTGYVDEIIVVDNNSKDRTSERATTAGARVVVETQQGYGAALQCGMREATGFYIVLAEPDGTFLASDILKLLSYTDCSDLVLGTRTAPQLIWNGANMGHMLRYGNEIVAKMIEFLFGGPSLTDCGCTFRLINRTAYEKIAPYLTVTQSHFLPEMVILALRLKIRVLEIPVNYRTRVGQSKITGSFRGAATTAIRMILLIFRYRLNTHLSAK